MSNSFVEFEEVAEPVHHMCDIYGKYCSSKSTIKENYAVGRGETKTTIPHVVRHAVGIKTPKCYKSYICVYTEPCL